MDINEKFNAFLTNLQNEENATVVESVRAAYKACFEAGLTMSNLGGTSSMDNATRPTKTINSSGYNKPQPQTPEETEAHGAQEKKDQMLIRRKTSSLARTFRNVSYYAAEHPEIVEKMYNTIVKPAIKEGYAKMDDKLGTDASGKSFGNRLKKAIGAFKGEGIEEDPETLVILESLAFSCNLVDD